MFLKPRNLIRWTITLGNFIYIFSLNFLKYNFNLQIMKFCVSSLGYIPTYHTLSYPLRFYMSDILTDIRLCSSYWVAALLKTHTDNVIEFLVNTVGLWKEDKRQEFRYAHGTEYTQIWIGTANKIIFYGGLILPPPPQPCLTTKKYSFSRYL